MFYIRLIFLIRVFQRRCMVSFSKQNKLSSSRYEILKSLNTETGTTGTNFHLHSERDQLEHTLGQQLPELKFYVFYSVAPYERRDTS
jgi:hypothetical protein